MATYNERVRHVSLKMERAKWHITQLEQQMQLFYAGGPCEVAVRRDPVSRKPTYYVAAVQSIPDAITLTAGDVLQNLMGTLDHLAYQLVCRDTNDQPPHPSRIYFPIADDQVKYHANKARRMPGARPATVAAIDALRPYRAGDDLVWLLYRLNNIDKHRLLLTVGSQAGGIHLGQLLSMHMPPDVSDETAEMLDGMRHFLEGMTQYLMPADKGFPLTPGFALYTGGPDEPYNPKLQFRFQVALNEPGIAEGTPLIDVIQGIAGRVDAVVTALTPLLR